MLKPYKLRWALAVLAALAVYLIAAEPACAKGGGHGGGGHHGGGHHGGGHHASHHGGHHGEHNHHPYHPSHHHTAHHSHDHHGDHHHDHHGDHHHDHHHYAHHHHSWHNGGWGPGFWGGAAVGYGLGYGYNNWGGWGYDGDAGDTYVDNSVDNSSNDVTPASNESDDDANDGADDASDDAPSNTPGPNGTRGFATDDWPELGVTTYAGQNGASQGQVIVRIVPGSAAEKAGLVPGDVILSFNGKPVPSADDLDAAMDGANGKFEVVVWDARTGRKSTIDGNLDAAAPQPNETAAIPPVQQ